jgi:phosphoglycerol transferase MdoB-like AlkP superfamily enzyme
MGIIKTLSSSLRPFRRLLLAMAFLEGYYFLLRVVFIVYNYRLFTFQGTAELIRIFLWGCRMDLSALGLLNLPALFLFFIAQYFPPRPGREIVRSTRFFHRIPLQLLPAWSAFILLNTAGLAINILDAGYFRFVKHRSNLDLIYVLGDSAGSFGSLFLRYLPLPVLFIVSVWVLIRLAGWVFVSPGAPVSRRTLPIVQAVLILLFFIAIRGWQDRPIIPAAPLLSLDPVKLPLAQNSVGTFIYSALNREEQIAPENYFSQTELHKIISTVHYVRAHPPLRDSLHRKNVLLFILESFSRCYVMPGDRWKARTPFFDSLLRKSIFFPNSFANGFSSNQGIVAILGGLPAFTDEPFFYSSYANTPLHSIGNILKDQGYNTNFFMGASRDHFGFGKFAHMAGLEHTYWRNDFDDERFYDGNWGIFDEPFLQYGAGVLSAKPQPFLGVFFTISAHPPYTLPENARRQCTIPGQNDAQNSITYTDFAFSRFFASCRDKPWFRNTIFIFCADHFLDPDEGRTHFSYLDFSTIPIFVYEPDRDTGEMRPTVAGQVDLTPTILDLLGYNGSYTGFGRSLLDTSIADSNRYVVNRLAGNYEIITDRFILGYNQSQERSCYFYQYAKDSALKHDLLNDRAYAADRNRLERLIRANIQAYSQSLNRRSLE